MKILGLENLEGYKKLNKHKVAIGTAVVVIVSIILIIVAVYISNRSFRNFVDEKILRKTVQQNKLMSIELDTEVASNIYAYDDKITILEKGKLTNYTVSGKQENELSVEINNPIYSSSNKFLAIGEKNNKKIYLINSENVVWEKELEGNISKLSVNKNGYVVVALTGTTYKNVIEVIDVEGKELFKTYLSNTIAMDLDISSDNKYMAFSEIDTSGTLIQSTIKVVSIEKAKQNPSEAIISTCKADIDELVVDIKYHDKDKLYCLFNDKISVVDNNTLTDIAKIDNDEKKINYGSIDLNNSVIRIFESSTGIFKSDTTVEITDTTSKKENTYIAEGVLKEIYTSGDMIAINFGTEVHFIDKNGWLIKKYTSNQEVQQVVLTQGLAGIVYRDKVELISL